MKTLTLIQKEDLVKIQFLKEEAIKDPIKRLERSNNLYKAMILGNDSKGKVTLSFLDREGKELGVETTVWALHEEFVSLKAGLFIPINAITQVII